MLDIPAGIGAVLGFALCIFGHEIVTAYVTVATGDRAPKLYGRLTAQPKAHADPVGTYILPGVFTLGYLFSSPFPPVFGWGKHHALGTGRRSLAPAFAGPATTLAIALIASVAVRGGGGTLAFVIFEIACSLTVIELLPIPGRDGGRILRRFLSPSASSTFDDLEKYEVLFLLVLFLFLRPLLLNMIAALADLLLPAASVAPFIPTGGFGGP